MKIRNLRWGIAVLLLLASILNYVDRQTLSILVPTIQADLKISDAEYGHIVSLFLVAYTVAYLLSGRIVDALGPRVSMALFVGWWSLSNLLTGFAKSFGSLGAFRFLLGLGEAGGYTASPKIVRQWFPPKDRGIAVGIYSVGGAIGATLAPVLVLALSARYGWRGAFFATGALGLVFVALWLLVFRNPETHPWLTDGEKSLILADESAEEAQVKEPVLTEAARWRSIVSSRAVWALMFARLLTDPVWYFFQFWMPKYLHAERGYEQADLASMWMIYLAADIGFLGSGFISGRMIRGGRDPREARLRTMLGCALLVPLAPLIALTSRNAVVFGISMVVVLAHTAWLASISTYVVDYVPKPILGTAFGFIAAGSAVGGILMNEAVARTISTHSYAPCFYAMVLLHPLAWSLLRRFARKPWITAAA